MSRYPFLLPVAANPKRERIPLSLPHCGGSKECGTTWIWERGRDWLDDGVVSGPPTTVLPHGSTLILLCLPHPLGGFPLAVNFDLLDFVMDHLGTLGNLRPVHSLINLAQL